MKGLLYKEWCLLKKNLGTFFLIAMVFTVLGVLVFLSMECGNLRNFKDEAQESVAMFLMTFTYVPYIIFLLSSEVCNTSVCSDYATGWMKFSYTLPAKPEVIVGAKYTFGLIIMLLSLVYSIFNSVIMYAMAGKSYSVDVVKNLILIFIVAVGVYAIFMPISYKFKKLTTVNAMGAVFAVGAYLGFGALLMYGDEKYGDQVIEWMWDCFNKLSKTLAYVSPLIVAVVLGVSFIISVKLYKRREKAC